MKDNTSCCVTMGKTVNVSLVIIAARFKVHSNAQPTYADLETGGFTSEFREVQKLLKN